MTKPYHRIAFCSCGTQFNARDRWQRSCEKCLEARAAAEAAKPPQACRRCGSQQDVSNRLCPSCRATKQAKEKAESVRREQRMMVRFGPCPYHPEHPATHDGVCFKCHGEVVKARRKQALQQEIAAKRTQEEEEGKYAWLDDLSAAELSAVVQYLRAWCAMMGVEVPTPAVEPPPVPPEEIPHDDQDAIDAAFRDIMEDIDL